MRVFVTGATGFIGNAVVSDLLAAGHTVLGLARSDSAAETLKRLGAEVHRGELSDLDSLVAGARAADGVVHLAFIHDFNNYAQSIEADRSAIRAMTAALEGSGKPFVGTSGSMLLASGRTGAETDSPPTEGHVHPRGVAEGLALGSAARGVRASLVRLAPSVHGRGDHGFVPFFIKIAREKGFAAYVGDGANRWPAVHRLVRRNRPGALGCQGNAAAQEPEENHGSRACPRSRFIAYPHFIRPPESTLWH